jgi:8-oxo-dGTP pyrophosphatase MutT (NUDIX family)
METKKRTEMVSYSSVVSSGGKDMNTFTKTTNPSIFCNNCGKYGHMSYQCNTPITSIGIIAFRNRPSRNLFHTPKPTREYLLIRRKDTLGYIDFIRGKYSVYNKQYILNMFKQMTNEERQRILKYAKEENTQDYGFKLWRQLWTNDILSITPFTHYSSSYNKNDTNKYFKSTEEKISKEKFTTLANGRGMGKGRHPFHLQTLVDECKQFPEWEWDEPEWGFPKGRRDTEESDWVCALREFKEETGQPSDISSQIPSSLDSSSVSIHPKPIIEPPPGLPLLKTEDKTQTSVPKYSLRPQIPSVSVDVPPIPEQKIKPIANLFPFEENFLGSNYKPYKHKYYLMQIEYDESDITFRSTEVSKVAWKTYEECMEIFRFYNVEKKQMLSKIHYMLENFTLI